MGKLENKVKVETFHKCKIIDEHIKYCIDSDSEYDRRELDVDGVPCCGFSVLGGVEHDCPYANKYLGLMEHYFPNEIFGQFRKKAYLCTRKS